MLRKLDQIIDFSFKLFAVISLTAMVVLVFYNAVLRYFFDSSMPQSEELARFAFIWVSMMGIIVANKTRSHVCVTILTDRLKGIPSHVVRVIREIVILGTMSLLLYGGIRYTLHVNFTSPATNIPFWTIAISLPIMAGTFLLMTIIQNYHEAKKFLTKNKENKEGAK